MVAPITLGHWLLAAVFAVAGYAKLADRARTSQSFEEFGVPAVLVRAAAILLPVAELAVAILLLVPPLAPAATLAAAVLLGLFTTAIAANILSGRRPTCQCFGQIASAPVGWRTLLRNLALLALAISLAIPGIAAPLEPAIAALATLDGIDQLLLTVLLLLLLGMAVSGWLSGQLLAQNGRLLLRIEALEARHPTATVTHAGAPIG